MSKNTTTINDKTIIDIYNAEGTAKEIADKYNVSVTTVRRIKNLVYKKYKDVIFNWKQSVIDSKKEAEIVKTSAKQAKSSKEDDLILKIRNINKEILAGDIMNVLVKYLTVNASKWAIDNYIMSDKNDALIQDVINKIKSENIDFYVKTLTTLTIGILSTIYSQEVLDKIFPQEGN